MTSDDIALTGDPAEQLGWRFEVSVQGDNAQAERAHFFDQPFPIISLQFNREAITPRNLIENSVSLFERQPVRPEQANDIDRSVNPSRAHQDPNGREIGTAWGLSRGFSPLCERLLQ
jgi:hypothetical protein